MPACACWSKACCWSWPSRRAPSPASPARAFSNSSNRQPDGVVAVMRPRSVHATDRQARPRDRHYNAKESNEHHQKARLRRAPRHRGGRRRACLALTAACGRISGESGSSASKESYAKTAYPKADEATLKEMATKVLNTERGRERAAARDPAGADDVFEALDGRPAQDLQRVPRQGRLRDRPGRLHLAIVDDQVNTFYSMSRAETVAMAIKSGADQEDPPLRQRRGRTEVPGRLALRDRSG